MNDNEIKVAIIDDMHDVYTAAIEDKLYPITANGFTLDEFQETLDYIKSKESHDQFNWAQSLTGNAVIFDGTYTQGENSALQLRHTFLSQFPEYSDDVITLIAKDVKDSLEKFHPNTLNYSTHLTQHIQKTLREPIQPKPQTKSKP